MRNRYLLLKLCALVLSVLPTGLLAQEEPAQKILEAYGQKEGNGLVIDGDENLSLALAQGSDLRIYLVQEDQKAIDAMRSGIDKAGRYGRITARVEKTDNIFFPDYFFDLVVVKDLKLTQEIFQEIFRLLQPAGRGIFVGGHGIKELLEKTDAAGVKESKVEEAQGLTVLTKGYEQTSKYLRPPLTRLWVAAATQEKGTRSAEFNLKKGLRDEVITSPTIGNMHLDTYTGREVQAGEEYKKSEYEKDRCPYSLPGRWDGKRGGRGVGGFDPETGERIFRFAPFLKNDCCSLFHYANGVSYKADENLITAYDDNGEMLWMHRSGYCKCGSPWAARSMLFVANPSSFRMHAFVSDREWDKRVPPGDRLLAGKGKIEPREQSVSPADWPMFHYDACRTGNSPDKEIQPPLKLLWKFDTGGRVRSSAAVADGTVYVGSGSHKFYALDAETGKVKWRFFTDDEIHSSPCVWGDGVYFGSDDGRIYALVRKTGNLAWAFKTDTLAQRTPVLNAHFQSKRLNELAELVKNNREIRKKCSPPHSVSPLCFNGQPLSGPGAVRSSPLVANGVLYVGTGLGEDAQPCWGYLYALDAATGKPAWKVGEEELSEMGELPFGIANSPCMENDRVHFSYGLYTVLDAGRGTLLRRTGYLTGGHDGAYFFEFCGRGLDGVWHGPGFLEGVKGDVAVDGGAGIAFIASRANVFAVDVKTGKIRWAGRVDTQYGFYPDHYGKLHAYGNANYHQPVALDGKRVYVGGGKGVAVFEPQTDKDRPSLSVGISYALEGAKPSKELSGPQGFVNTAPAIANGFVYAGSDDGGVYAWKLDGEDKPVWSFATGGKVRSSPAVARGRLYIGSDDGFIYCFGPVKEEPK